jgi:hypothetical protein
VKTRFEIAVKKIEPYQTYFVLGVAIAFFGGVWALVIAVVCMFVGYQGRDWTIQGLAPREPWSRYVLIGDGFAPFTASLPSLELSRPEALRRERVKTAKKIVAACTAVLAKHGVSLDPVVSVSNGGLIRLSWMSSLAIRAENRAAKQNREASGQYIGAALLLLQATRAHIQRGEGHDVESIADRAARLRERVKA